MSMFLFMRNGRIRGTAMVAALEKVTSRLPPGWSAGEQASGRSSVLTLRGPDGSTAQLRVIARDTLTPRDVPALLAAADEHSLVVAPYLGARSQQLLSGSGVNYADATGNLRVVVSRPAIFLEGQGAVVDPKRTPRPLRSLKG